MSSARYDVIQKENCNIVSQNSFEPLSDIDSDSNDEEFQDDGNGSESDSDIQLISAYGNPFFQDCSGEVSKNTKPKKASKRKPNSEEVPDEGDISPGPLASSGHIGGSRATNKIYFFYEKLEANPNGLIGHLSSKFPAMFKFYKYLQDRGTELSEEELKIARGEKQLDPEAMAKFLGKLDADVNTILKAFKRQTLKNENDFDYNVFKDLLCNYLIAQDHPFDTVECPHLAALLNYVHHQSTPLKIHSRHE
ncbi:hypothetical protein MPER_07576, partial [Moniliophthora perniciosa FA553]